MLRISFEGIICFSVRTDSSAGEPADRAPPLLQRQDAHAQSSLGLPAPSLWLMRYADQEVRTDGGLYPAEVPKTGDPDLGVPVCARDSSLKY